MHYIRSLDSSVSVVIRLQDGGIRNRGSIPNKDKKSLFSKTFKTVLRFIQTPIQSLAEASRPGVKRPDSEAEHSRSSSAKNQIAWTISLRGQHWDTCIYQDKFHPITCHEGTEGEEVYLYSIFNLGTKWVHWLKPRPNRFTPGMTRRPMFRRVGGIQGGLDGCIKSPLIRIRSPDVHPIASHYTDYPNPALYLYLVRYVNCVADNARIAVHSWFLYLSNFKITMRFKLVWVKKVSSWSRQKFFPYLSFVHKYASIHDTRMYLCNDHTCHMRVRGGLSVHSFSLKLCTYKPPRTLIESDSTICCTCTTVSSWRWALEARNM